MAQAKNRQKWSTTMTEQYTANPTRETVDALADELGKTTRSIIAKLSREGVYIAQPRTTKSGEPVISKVRISCSNLRALRNRNANTSQSR